jgi:CAAX protease family protein
MQKKRSLYIECAVLFYLLPCLLYFVRRQLAFRIFGGLLLLALGCTFILMGDPDFDRRCWQPKRQPQYLTSMVALFLPSAAFLSMVAYVVWPSKFFVFPMSRPFLWLIVMLLYPPLLVLPQEMLFRCFFFHRYRLLFEGREKTRIVLNALSFGLAHLFYGNWVAPVLGFCGGLLFAWRYQESGSLLTVGLEHALWGDFLFTIGIGWFFYSGSIR